MAILGVLRQGRKLGNSDKNMCASTETQILINDFTN